MRSVYFALLLLGVLAGARAQCTQAQSDLCHVSALLDENTCLCYCPDTFLGDGADCSTDGYVVRKQFDSETDAKAMLTCTGNAQRLGTSSTQCMSLVVLKHTTLGGATKWSGNALFNFLADANTASGSIDDSNVYTWHQWQAGSNIKLPGAGFVVTSVNFDTVCETSGCWVVGVDYAVGHSNVELQGVPAGINTFYIPYAVGDDSLSVDFTYSTAVEDSFAPANFPCEADDMSKNKLSCLAGFTAQADGGYRPLESFVTWADAVDPAAVPKDVVPGDTFIAADEHFQGMNHSSIRSVTERDGYLGMYSAVFQFDEVELRRYAGKLIGTVGVEHTVDFFVGLANMKPAGNSMILDTLASQTEIHVEKTNFFSVSTHGTNDYTFLEYVNMRLISIYNEDKDFSDGAGEVSQNEIQTSSTGSADYVQVTFTLGTKYEVNTNDDLIPTSSVRAGRGTFIGDAVMAKPMTHLCDQWANGQAFAGYDDFTARQNQGCSPGSTMCLSPSSIPDQFVSFNIPLGIDYFGSASSTLDNNVFVDMVVSAIVKDGFRNQVSSTVPNEGGDPYQMKTTLTASIPVVAGGVNIFCDGIVAKTDLKDVANADIVVGSAQDANEWTRLMIKSDIASTAMVREPALTEINTASIESGLMTLVLKGNASYFETNSGRSQVTLELEDVITIHIMEEDGTGADASVVAYVDGLLAELPDDNTDSATGLITSGYKLNGAFEIEIDRPSQRAHLQPLQALLDRCPFNPPRPASAVGLETCIIRRDVQYRGYPARVGGSSTAIEICVGADGAGSVTTGCDTATTSSVESDFMVTIFGDSNDAKDLAVGFATTIYSQYNLNGRYRRAYWINPGYEWTPMQTGGNSIFTLSQKIFMFCLITLDEDVADVAGAPGDTPSFVRRRMLLQSSTNDALKDGQSSLGTERLQFETSTQSLMANAFSVPTDRVASYTIDVQLTEEEMCMTKDTLAASLRETFDDFLSDTATAIHTVQVTKVVVSGADCSGRRRSIRALKSSFSSATAEVTMLVVFKAGQQAELDTSLFGTKPGVNSVEALNVSPKVASVLSPDYVPPADEEESSSSNVGLIAGIAGGVGALLVLVVGGIFFFRNKQKAEPVTAVQTINVEDLKSQLSAEV